MAALPPPIPGTSVGSSARPLPPPGPVAPGVPPQSTAGPGDPVGVPTAPATPSTRAVPADVGARPLPPPTAGAAVPAAKPRRNRPGLLLGLVALVAWLSGLVGAFVGVRVALDDDAPPTRPSDAALNIADPRPGFEQRIDVAAVAALVAPSTVTVSADIGDGVGVGTGVIISADGEIITNAHVVDGADEVRVRLAGESEPRSVAVLAVDRGNDLALLRMAGDGFEAATFADPDSVRIGDDVMAIGFALGLDGAPSVTLGIISALDRSVGQGDVYLDGLIQTDAAISSGNSGGPLVNAAGEVVGINTAVARDTAIFTATNVGFAISTREALPVIEALRAQANGIEREEAFFGVGLEDRRDGGQGVFVTGVEPNTPAAGSGVEVGDLIVAVDGAATDGSSGLIAAIRDKQPGDAVTITVVRDGDPFDVDVTLIARP